jgi:hypothetical protein
MGSEAAKDGRHMAAMRTRSHFFYCEAPGSLEVAGADARRATCQIHGAAGGSSRP